MNSYLRAAEKLIEDRATQTAVCALIKQAYVAGRKTAIEEITYAIQSVELKEIK